MNRELIGASYSTLLFFVLQYPIQNVGALLFTFGVLKRFFTYLMETQRCKKPFVLGDIIGPCLFEGVFYLTSIFLFPASLHMRLLYIFGTSFTTELLSRRFKFLSTKIC